MQVHDFKQINCVMQDSHCSCRKCAEVVSSSNIYLYNFCTTIIYYKTFKNKFLFPVVTIGDLKFYYYEKLKIFYSMLT